MEIRHVFFSPQQRVFWRSRRGILLPIVFFILVILGLFAFQYNRMVSHTQAQSFRLEQTEIAQRLAEAGIDEAFLTFQRETADGESPLSLWLALRQAPEIKPIDIPLLKKALKSPGSSWFHSSLTPDVEVTVQRVDFRARAEDHNTPFYGKEGIGTLAFSATVSLSTRLKKISTCTLLRHHDYKVVSMVSPMESHGSGYVDSSLLDFALFVRNGYKEFLTTNGHLLKDPAHHLSVEPASGSPQVFGNVYVNGVDSREYQMFLPNVASNPEQMPFPIPRFFDRHGSAIDPASPRFRPYVHEDLWSRSIPYKSHLKTAKILENDRLNLKGIIRSVGSVDIDQPTTYHGQGILIADEFRIRAGLTKHCKTDLCVLYAMAGNITIETGDEIQAALIAMSNANVNDRIGRIHVLPGQTLNLTGCLIADYLDLNHWPANVLHKITYDRGFRRSQDLYQITLSKWISFSRFSETSS